MASDPGTLIDGTIDWNDIWEVGGNPQARTSVTAQLYRYVAPSAYRNECQTIRDRSFIPTSGSTWLTPNRYAWAADAEKFLALPHPPGYRIGPVWALDIAFDGIAARVSPPRFGKPGGAWELTTTRPIPFGERHNL
jgi:hypothetical protein